MVEIASELRVEPAECHTSSQVAEDLSSLTKLWHTEKDHIRGKIGVLNRITEWVEHFSDIALEFETWLIRIEDEVEVNQLRWTDKDRKRMRMVYEDDLESYTQKYLELRKTAIQILVHSWSLTFRKDIYHRFVCISKRWNHVRYLLQVEQTKVTDIMFLMLLVGEMLRQMNNWCEDVTTRLKEIHLDSCDLKYMEWALHDIQDTMEVFSTQAEELQITKSVLKNVQQHHTSFIHTEGIETHLEIYGNVEINFCETLRKYEEFKECLLNRIAVYSEWSGEVTLMKDWMDQLAKGLDNDMVVDDFCTACKSLERIQTTCSYLTSSSTCSSADEITHITHMIELQFQERDLIVVIEQWITEAEKKLATLHKKEERRRRNSSNSSPVTLEEEEKIHLQILQELNRELNELNEYIEVLMVKDDNQPKDKDDNQPKVKDDNQLTVEDDNQPKNKDDSQLKVKDGNELRLENDTQLKGKDDNQLELKFDDQLDVKNDNQLEVKFDDQLNVKDDNKLILNDDNQLAVDRQLKFKNDNQHIADDIQGFTINGDLEGIKKRCCKAIQESDACIEKLVQKLQRQGRER